jgi:hypothetical protein
MPEPTPFDREACRRLPLAEACLRLLAFVTDADFLQGVFDRHHGRSYQRDISFPLFVHLIADALLEHHGSGRQSFTRAREDGELGASVQAAYGKLARLPIGLSQGFLAESTRRLLGVFPAPAAQPPPPSLAGLAVCALDGKKLKYVAHRLKPLRRLKGQVLGGKLVVALDVGTGLAVALAAHPDGEASDAPLVPAALAQARAAVAGPRLWLADRQFCDLNQPGLLAAAGDHFLIRYNAKVRFHPDPARPAREGVDRRGRRYVQEWGWVGQEKDPRRRYVRRVSLCRPGEEDVIVLTDLTDEQAYPAEDLLEAYLARWGIERCFQRVTEVFALGHLIGGTPEATVFQAAFCLLLYNVVLVLRGYLAGARGRAAEAVSSAQLFYDVRRQLVAWSEVLTPEATVGLVGGRLGAAALAARLGELLGGVWTDRWLKAPPRKAPPKDPPAKHYLRGGHSSVYRLLRHARQEKQIKRVVNSS